MLANGVNIGGYEYIMQMIFPTDSYGYINILTDKMKLDNRIVTDENKGRLLKTDILRWLQASKLELKGEAAKVPAKEFEATYRNVYFFFYYLNEGVYLNIWTLAEKARKEAESRKEAEATSGGKKKTRRRKKSKRKRKSRRARR